MMWRHSSVWSKRKRMCLPGALAVLAVAIGVAAGCGRAEEMSAVSVTERQGRYMDGRSAEVGEMSGTVGELIMGGGITTLICAKETAREEQAGLYQGEGYSIAVPEDGWTMFAPGSWCAAGEERVRFWIGSYAGLNQGQVERILANQGYQAEERNLWKQEGDTLYFVQCIEAGQDVWTLNSVISPPEIQDDWMEALQTIFDTFAVTKGYDVGAATPKAVMPEDEQLQLSEGIYADDTSRLWVLQDPDYAGSYIYNELIICNVTDRTFDFEVVRRNYETDESEIIIPLGTAYIKEDGISAVYEGEDFTLTFDFSDSSNPLPIVFYIDVWGVADLEGISFFDDDVPGYDAG